MTKPKSKRVRIIKRTRAINNMKEFWAALEHLTAQFNDSDLSGSFTYTQKYGPTDDLASCYGAWRMLLILTRSAMQRRDAALMRNSFDLIECCEMTRNPKLILEPSYAAFWEELGFNGAHKELARIIQLMPRHCRETYLNFHPELRR